jgi:Two component regulator propeller
MAISPVVRFLSGADNLNPTDLSRPGWGPLDCTLTHGLIQVHRGKVDTFSSSDGLSGDPVFTVLEDREGNVWVATNDGLDRFRASSAPTSSRKQGVSNTLPFCSLAATDGRVWIATFSGVDRPRLSMDASSASLSISDPKTCRSCLRRGHLPVEKRQVSEESHTLNRQIAITYHQQTTTGLSPCSCGDPP